MHNFAYIKLGIPNEIPRYKMPNFAYMKFPKKNLFPNKNTYI